MKADSFHTVFSEKPSKYGQFLGQQLFTGYRVRGKEASKKSQTHHSPSEDKVSTSQSYVMAMKALQDKIRVLEGENLNLQAVVLSLDQSPKQIVKQEVKVEEKIILKNNAVEIQLIKEDYENKLQILQQNILSITQQADQKYRELSDEIQILTEQLEIQNQNNINYRTKINQLTQSLLQEKQNQNTLQYMLEQERQENKFMSDKNEKLQQEIISLKEDFVEIEKYLEQQQYVAESYQKLATENQKQQQTIFDMMKEIESYKDQCNLLQMSFEFRKNEMQKSEFRVTKKLSESNVKVEQLKQQLLNFHSAQFATSPYNAKKKNHAIKSVSQEEMQVKGQKLRDQRQIMNKSNKKQMEKQFLTSLLSQQQNQQQSSKQSQEKANESQCSLLSRLITRTQEENYATQQKSDETEEMILVETNPKDTNKKQEFKEAKQRIEFLDELLQSLNLKYEDVEAQVKSEQDFKLKKEKRKELLKIIEQMQGVDKELNDLITIQKLASQQ